MATRVRRAWYVTFGRCIYEREKYPDDIYLPYIMADVFLGAGRDYETRSVLGPCHSLPECSKEKNCMFSGLGGDGTMRMCKWSTRSGTHTEIRLGSSASAANRASRKPNRSFDRTPYYAFAVRVVYIENHTVDSARHLTFWRKWRATSRTLVWFHPLRECHLSVLPILPREIRLVSCNPNPPEPDLPPKTATRAPYRFYILFQKSG